MPITKQQLLIIGAIAVAVVLGGILLFRGLKPEPSSHITLTVWGVNDDKTIWDNLTKRYAQETQNKVVYVKKSEATYERELVDALASGTGPDVFYFRNTWFLSHFQKVVAAPKSIATGATVEENYPATVKRDFVSNDQVIALPLFIDSLALLYNPALLDQAAIPFPPKTWEELTQMVPQLTKFDDRKNILISGAALGTSANVAHSADLAMLLMMQSGSPMVDAKSVRADLGTNPQNALSFYAQFANNQNSAYSWNSTMANSLDEFARGKVAFAFAYGRDIAYLREVAPYFTFKIAPMPQPQQATLRKDFADYWGLAVSKQSRNQLEAWRMIAAVTDAQEAQWYSQRTNLSPAKKSIITQFRNDPLLDVFTRQAYTALNWAQPNASGVKELFEQTIDNIARSRTTIDNAVRSLEAQLNRMFDAL